MKRDTERAGRLDETFLIAKGDLLTLVCLALSWKFDGTWGAFFMLCFWFLAIWMLLA